MKIFISYASEDQGIADSISARLEADKHKSFFDRTSLPYGESYDGKIREAIAKADLFLFLISPRSVEAGSYCQTELTLARSRWPNASGRLLSVVIEPTPMENIPAYARAGTLVFTPGNLEADILAAVEKISVKRTRRLRWALGIPGVIAIAASLYAFFGSPPPDTVCYLTAELRREDAGIIAPAMTIDVRYAETTNSFLVSENSASIGVGPFRGNDFLWKIGLRGPDGSELGEATLKGCVTGEQGVRIGEVFSLILHPRE